MGRVERGKEESRECKNGVMERNKLSIQEDPKEEGGGRGGSVRFYYYYCYFFKKKFYTLAMISSPDHFPCSSDRPVGARRNHEGAFCYLF